MIQRRVVTDLGIKPCTISEEEYQMYRMTGQYVRMVTRVDEFVMHEWSSNYTLVSRENEEEQGLSVASWMKKHPDTLYIANPVEWSKFKQLCKECELELEL